MSKLPGDTNPRILTEIQSIERNGQTIAHRKFTKKPQLADIPEAGFVIGEDSGTKFIYTKIGGKRFKAVLTLDP